MAYTEEPNLRIVLLGRAGSGKSASGNTILRSKAFKSCLSPSIVTSECDKITAEFDDHQILTVVDTPCLFDPTLLEQEVKRCMSFAAPGPHVFLVVLRLGRFTKEEKEAVKIIQEMFGENATGHTMVLFTHLDHLQIAGVPIEEFISRNKELGDFILQCGGVYHVFDNTIEDISQVRKLLQKISTMVKKNEGSYYTNKTFQQAEHAIGKIQELVKEPNMEPKEAGRQAARGNQFSKEDVLTTYGVPLGVAIGSTVKGAHGALMGAVLGVAVREGILNRLVCTIQQWFPNFSGSQHP